MAHTYDMDGSTTETIGERQEKKRKNIKTPDNIKFGDMPADFKKRYLQMLEQQRKK